MELHSFAYQRNLFRMVLHFIRLEDLGGLLAFMGVCLQLIRNCLNNLKT